MSETESKTANIQRMRDDAIAAAAKHVSQVVYAKNVHDLRLTLEAARDAVVVAEILSDTLDDNEVRD